MRTTELIPQFVPGGVARSYWGRARLKVCAALMERARRLIDTHHILIKPSITGLQALCMYNQLLHMSDMQPQGDERFMEGKLTSPEYSSVADLQNA